MRKDFEFYNLLIALFLISILPNIAYARSEYLITWWNVENLFDTQNDPKTDDDEFTPSGKKEWTNERLKTKLINLAKVIKDLSEKNGKHFPDIAGYCEVENESLLNLLYGEYLKSKGYKIVYHESKDVRGIDVAMVFNEQSFALVEKKTIFIPLYDRPTRDILKIRLRDKKTKKELYVFLNHWPSRMGGPAKTESYRIQAAKKLRASVESILKEKPQADIIILGDFNDEPYSESVSVYLKAIGNKSNVLVRAFDELYNFAFPSTAGTVSFQHKWFKFDQIILSKGMFDSKGFFAEEDAYEVFEPDYLKTLDGKRKKHIVPFRTYSGGTYLGGYSDHFPVLLKFFVED